MSIIPINKHIRFEFSDKEFSEKFTKQVLNYNVKVEGEITLATITLSDTDELGAKSMLSLASGQNASFEEFSLISSKKPGAKVYETAFRFTNNNLIAYDFGRSNDYNGNVHILSIASQAMSFISSDEAAPDAEESDQSDEDS